LFDKFELLKKLQSMIATPPRSIGDLVKLAQQFGVEAKLDRIPMDREPAIAELSAIAKGAVRPGAEFYRVGAVVDGRSIHAFVVVGAK
jgi:hypothetical protein